MRDVDKVKKVLARSKGELRRRFKVKDWCFWFLC